MVIRLMASGSARKRWGRRTTIGKWRSLPFIEVASGLPADGRLYGRVDISGAKTGTRGANAIDIDADRRLAEGD